MDECKNEELCQGGNEDCKNTAGSYSCECSSGYKRKEGKCIKGKQKKKKKNAKKNSTKTSGDEELLEELQKGNYLEEWHLKFGSFLYAVFFGLLILAYKNGSVVGGISLIVTYAAVIWGLKTKYE